MSVLDDPRALNRFGTVAQAASAMIGGVSHIQFGLQAQQAAEFQAAQLRMNAGEQQASAQRGAYDVQRQAQYVASAALARAAGSGAGALDPTVVSLISRNAGEMAYRQAVALYQGDERARAMRAQADAKEYEGGSIRANSMLAAGAQFASAGGSILRGAAKDTLLARFGGGGPLTNPTED